MTLFKNKYRVESMRLKKWDYGTAGYYYVTICAKKRDQKLFGKISQENVVLNKAGFIVKKTWECLPGRYNNVCLHDYILMPDHFHAIIQLKQRRDGVPPPSPKTTENKTLSSIIGGFKSYTTKKINENTNNKGKIWQERFHDRILRDEKELKTKIEYIRNNVLKEYLKIRT